MPPKVKFTREQITKAALDIVRAEGFEGLTAKMLGKKFESSVYPIFTVFENMREVQQSVMEATRNIYKEYIEKGLSETIAFKRVGTQYILFAINEPKLLRILFMSKQTQLPDIDHVLSAIDKNYDKILVSITAEFGIEGKDAEKLYQHLWIYTHGIVSLCATKMCRFTNNEINEMLSEVFISLLNHIKGGKEE